MRRGKSNESALGALFESEQDWSDEKEAPMQPIDYTASASVSWQHPPYGATAIEEFVEDFNLGEAVRFVMERLTPAHHVQAIEWE
jgi:hypothetical protein